MGHGMKYGAGLSIEQRIARLEQQAILQSSLASCRVYSTTSGNVVTVPSATVTPIPFNAELWDTDDLHDTTTDNTQVLLPRIGIWEVGMNVLYLPSTGYTNAADLWALIRRNGSDMDLQSIVSSYGAVNGHSSSPGGQASTIIRTTDTDDYVEFCAYCDNTATQVYNTSGDSSQNTAWVRYLGP